MEEQKTQTTLIEEQTAIEAPAPERVPLSELEDGCRVQGVYAVRDRELRRKSVVSGQRVWRV